MTDNRNFNDLYAFTQVIRQGNYSRAARVLNVQPSALSHRMAELEKRLGIRLINRTTRAMSPTEAGQLAVRTHRAHVRQYPARRRCAG